VRIPEGGARGTIVFSARNAGDGKTVFGNLRVYRLFCEEKPVMAETDTPKNKPASDKEKK
jgi:hypothetical protein